MYTVGRYTDVYSGKIHRCIQWEDTQMYTVGRYTDVYSAILSYKPIDTSVISGFREAFPIQSMDLNVYFSTFQLVMSCSKSKINCVLYLDG
jgi:hypothetical protein